jgi:hypothetical protein
MAVVINGTSGITGNTGTLISATTIGVGGTTPSASGAGVTFPATASASTDANTLDDYEEGTYSPIMVGSVSNPTVTYTKQAGKYTKIGNFVHVQIDLRWSALSSGSGSAFITLPFTSSNDQYSGGVVAEKNSGWTLSAGNTYMTWENNVGTGYLIILQSGAATSTGGMAYGTNVPTSTGYIIGSFTYTV